MLKSEEMSEFTNCTTYEETNPPGNLINKNTLWSISGSLIKRIQMSETEVRCIPRLDIWSWNKLIYVNVLRTLLVPIRYKTIHDAMSICESLGEKGDFLKPFESYSEWVNFYDLYKNSQAVEKYCDHGGRYMLWLPYQVINWQFNCIGIG